MLFMSYEFFFCFGLISNCALNYFIHTKKVQAFSEIRIVYRHKMLLPRGAVVRISLGNSSEIDAACMDETSLTRQCLIHH